MLALPTPALTENLRVQTTAAGLRALVYAILEELPQIEPVVSKFVSLSNEDKAVLRSHPVYKEAAIGLSAAMRTTAEEMLMGSKLPAVSRLSEILKNGDDKAALKAAEMILDRVDGKPVQTVNTISKSINLNISADSVKTELAQAEERLNKLEAQRQLLLDSRKAGNILNVEAELV